MKSSQRNGKKPVARTRCASMIAMPARRALISGITGQDGSYLAEWLLGKGYEVHGVVRRVAIEDPEHRLTRLDAIRGQIKLHAASLRELREHSPGSGQCHADECYHLAAQSFVSYSFDDEFSTAERQHKWDALSAAAAKILCRAAGSIFAGSSEMFGKADEVPQTERTRFHHLSLFPLQDPPI